MQVRLYALVRELPDGRFLAASVDFPHLLVEGNDASAALAALTTQLSAQLRRLGTVFRVRLGRAGEPELVRVPVDVPLGRKQESFSVTIPAFVVRRDGSGGELFRVRAVGIEQFEVATTRRDDVVVVAARELAKQLRHWPVDAVLALDDDGKNVTFEPLDLVLPPPPRRGGDDEDDEDVLAATGDELTAQAREGRLTPLDRRDDLVERVLGILASAKRSSVMLVGPRDVGKTTLVHEIAHRLARGDVPASLRGRELWRIPANELIAGARYTGDWQERARQLVDAARDDGPILMMGDPAGIVDAGRWSRSDNNLARFLRTYIESGEITVICESSPEVLAAAHKKEPSFVDVFHRVEVVEPSPEQAAEILRAAAGRVGARLGLTVDESAIAASIELTRRFEPYRSLPGKALHLLEEAAQRQAAAGEPTTARDDVVGAFTTRTGLPLALLSDEAPLELATVRAFFEERVLGQEDAVGSVVELISVIKAGLNDPGKPLGTFFFVGPTGVGKTELAKAVAEFLFGSRERMVRFDMGEFGAGDAIPRLIGTAWDSSSEGELTRKVREQPFCVVLLDEIDKAHPAVFDALLSTLGEGRLTDATGRTADFRNAILIMTSNLGAARRQSQAVGFSTGADEKQRLREHYREQAERFFRPEFVNRIDRIVAFDALDQGVVRRIARREVGRLLLREGLVRRRLLVEVDDAAVTRLAEEGFDPQYGARPLQRQIEQAVIQPLARLIVERRPPPGDIVRIHVRDGALAVDLESPPATPEERREARRERRAAPTQASTARAMDSVASLVAEIEADWTGPVAGGLRATVAELIDRTHTPTFWDDVAEARAVMARIYGLERVLDRLRRLLERASGLLELARHIQRTSDRARLSELRGAISEIGDELDLTRLELLGAAADHAGDGAAAVRVNPIGAAGVEWAAELLGMYRAWAERTGRDVRERDDRAPGALLIDGPSTLQLLAGECGVHRRRLADRTERLARVLVTSPDGDAPADSDPDIIVRVYEEGRRTGVKDTRTGTRSGALHDVLVEGRIEPFLVAALRDRRVD